MDHVLESTNKQIDRSDQTQPGYVGGKAAEEGGDSNSQTQRTMPPVVYRILHFVVHSAMLAAAVSDPQAASQLVAVICAQGTIGDKTTFNLLQFLSDHVAVDWASLRKILQPLPEEEVALTVHLALKAWYSEAEKQTAVVYASCSTKEERMGWEDHFASCVAPVVSDAQKSIRTYNATQKQEAGLVAEIREVVPEGLDSVPANERHLAALWRHRAGISLGHLKTQFAPIPENAVRYPVLALFLEQEQRIKCLRHLPAVVEWQRLLCLRFDRRIDRNYARDTTVGEVLAGLPKEELRTWQQAFKRFSAAWNDSWRYVDRFICLEIPKAFKEIQMDEKAPLCFSLPDERDEGICPLSFTSYMIDTHNRLVDGVSKVSKLHVASFAVPLHLVEESHMVAFDVERDLLPFVQMHAEQPLAYGRGSDTAYNFARIEQHVFDNVLSSKPMVEPEVRKFNFADEIRATGRMALLAQHIGQEDLPGPLQQKLEHELSGSPSTMRKCLQVLEICVGFLGSTGKSKTVVTDHVQQTLLIDDFPAVLLHVWFCHIASLWHLLEDRLVQDPFDTVLPKFKRALDSRLAEELRLAAPKLCLDILLPSMCESSSHSSIPPQAWAMGHRSSSHLHSCWSSKTPLGSPTSLNPFSCLSSTSIKSWSGVNNSQHSYIFRVFGIESLELNLESRVVR